MTPGFFIAGTDFRDQCEWFLLKQKRGKEENEKHKNGPVAQAVERPVEARKTRIRAPPGPLTICPVRLMEGWQFFNLQMLGSIPTRGAFIGRKTNEIFRAEVQLVARGVWVLKAAGSTPASATVTTVVEGWSPKLV